MLVSEAEQVPTVIPPRGRCVAWQNTGYNQPPHPSFFIGAGMPTAPRPTVRTP